MKLLVVFVVLAALSGCAVMDISSLDTAVPIYPETVSANAYMSIGIDYSSGFYMTDEEIEHILGHDGYFSDELCMGTLSGLRVGVALNERFDMQGKLYATGYCEGAKLGFKALIHQDGPAYYSLQPSITFMQGKYEQGPEEEQYHNEFSARGLELTGLLSRVHTKHTTATVALRLNASELKEEYYGKDFETKQIFHGGISGNLKFSFSKFFAGVELGVEIAPNHRSEVVLEVFTGLGLGVQF